jgi:hypothetical protein
MLTFVAAVVFWPITLLYFFIFYVVPFLFNCLIVLAYAVAYFVSHNPGAAICITVVALFLLSFSDSKAKKS